MPNKKRGLGKGFESLIPSYIEQEFDPTLEVDRALSRTQNVLISDITPNPNQPRQDFAQSALEELASSIKTHGVLQPVVVIAQNGGFTLIAGERRWRAAKLAGLKAIPAIVRTLDSQAQLEVALIENIQREDLNPLEMATALVKLNQQFNQSFNEIAQRLGKADSTVGNIVRLINLPSPAKRALATNRISEGHARQILALKDSKKQQELLDLIIRYGWNVRRAEQFVTALKEGAADSKIASRATRSQTPETKKIGKKLKTKVVLHKMAKGGRIIIDYKSDKELKRITEIISD
jgi:ParB family chromosome partitioning protein